MFIWNDKIFWSFEIETKAVSGKLWAVVSSAVAPSAAVLSSPLAVWHTSAHTQALRRGPMWLCVHSVLAHSVL